VGLTYVSVCSGIEAATVAVEPLGWRAIAFSEVDGVCNRFLRAKYPNVDNLGDMTEVNWSRPRFHANVLIGGTPCQSNSTMGRWRREITADMDFRGKLAFRYLHIADQIGADWFIWENVANVLSVRKGEFFRDWLGTAAGLGFGVAWRVLDTEDFGLPTSRSRLFAVGHRGGEGLESRALLQPRYTNRRRLPTAPKAIREERTDAADGAFDAGLPPFSIGFDGAGIGPRGRYEALPTLTKGHAGRFGLVTRGGDVRKISCVEAERSMGFPDGYTEAAGLSFRERHAVIGNSFSPRIVGAIAEQIDMLSDPRGT